MEDKNFTRLTLESGYGEKVTIELDHSDCTVDELIHAFYSAMIGITFNPITVIKGMQEFAEEYDDGEDNDEEDN